MNAQIIELEGKPEYAVLPYHEYLKLLELAEGVRDAEDARTAMRELVSGEDEAIPAEPAEVVNRLISGNEHPLKVWRKYREFTQEALGNATGVGKSYISQIEAGSKTGSAKALKALAKALHVDIDDLIVEYRN
jgi:DNA-binding XRE family transcriptional regulator